MAARAAAVAAAQAAQNPAMRYLVVVIVSVPLLFVVILLMLLGDGVAADASEAPAAFAGLRPGTVPADDGALVRKAAQTCKGITAPLLAAQLQQESGWNSRAVSPIGAQGLAQFMPLTWVAQGIDGDGDGVRDPFDPADAIASQAGFMCKLLAAVATDRSLTGDPIDLALAAYNAGHGAVKRYKGVPPYAETRGCITRIRDLTATSTETAPTVAGAGPPGSWVRPLQGGTITSGFGYRWGKLHAGIDFATPIGTPICAASDATVLAAGPAGGFGYGVKLQHPGKVTTVYGHISRWVVTVGQAVRAGQLIAYSGNEGLSTGPHLHFETRAGDSPVDPITFYAAQGQVLG